MNKFSATNDLRSVLTELGYSPFVQDGRVAIVVNKGREFQSALEITMKMCKTYGYEVLEDLEDVTVRADRVIFDNYDVDE